jgi:lipoprotein Spr
MFIKAVTSFLFVNLFAFYAYSQSSANSSSNFQASILSSQNTDKADSGSFFAPVGETKNLTHIQDSLATLESQKKTEVLQAPVPQVINNDVKEEVTIINVVEAAPQPIVIESKNELADEDSLSKDDVIVAQPATIQAVAVASSVITENKSNNNKPLSIPDNIAEEETTLSKNELFNQKLYFSEILGFDIDTVINPKVYENAIDWIRTPYHYGGDSRNGIDCSGFASVIYKNSYNITLGSSTSVIFTEVEPVEKAEMKEGDLVFFKIKRKRISHIGVYLGNNKFVHASRQAGVIVSDLDEPYYKKRFFKAGRHKAFLTHPNN